MLLLLPLGRVYAADELLAAVRSSAVAGLVDLVLNALPGAALALALGWGPVAVVALAGVTWVSSSGIVAKLLADLGQLGNRETPVVLAVLVVEHLAMAGYLPVLTALLSGVGVLAATGSVAVALLAVAAVLAVAVALRLPGLLARLVLAPDDEVLLLRVLGLTLLVAGRTIELDPRFGPLAAAYVLLLAVAGPVLARLLDARSARAGRAARRVRTPVSP